MAYRYAGSLGVSQGEYTDREGKTKTRWLSCGVLMENEEGKMLVKINAIPVSSYNRDGRVVPWDGLMQVFDKRDDKPEYSSRKTDHGQSYDDDIPF